MSAQSPEQLFVELKDRLDYWESVIQDNRHRFPDLTPRFDGQLSVIHAVRDIVTPGWDEGTPRTDARGLGEHLLSMLEQA